MIAIKASKVQVQDANAIRVELATPLVFNIADKEAWPEGDRDVDVSQDNYELKKKVWLRFVDLDAHKINTEFGKAQLERFEKWLHKADKHWTDDDWELEIYTTGEGFTVGKYNRIFGGLARRIDGDKWETTLLAVSGNTVAWTKQIPDK